MLKNFVKIFGGDPNKKVIEQYSGIAAQINSFEPALEKLSDESLRAKTNELRARIVESAGNLDGLDEREQFKAQQDVLNEILPEAFGVVREAHLEAARQRCARCSSCVTMTSVVPKLRFSSNINSITLSPDSVSRLPVGSSASSSFGRTTKARASATRCCSPPERWRG